MNTNTNTAKSGDGAAMASMHESAKATMPPVETSDDATKVFMREGAEAPLPVIGTLHTIAREFLADAQGDPKQAAMDMQDYLAEPSVRRAITEDAMKIAIAASMAAVRTYDRAAIEHQAQQQALGIMRRAGSVDHAMMRFPLPFGGILADASKADIMRAVEHYEVSAATQQRRAAWLRKIADKMPENQHVSAVLSEADLQKAWACQ
jgi:hypothetical protein